MASRTFIPDRTTSSVNSARVSMSRSTSGKCRDSDFSAWSTAWTVRDSSIAAPFVAAFAAVAHQSSNTTSGRSRRLNFQQLLGHPPVIDCYSQERIESDKTDTYEPKQ